MRGSPSRIFCLLIVAGGLRAATGAEVTGVVQDNLGNGLGGLHVNASIYSETNFASDVAVTDDAGRFTLAGESGFWRVYVDPTPLYGHGYFDVPPFSLDLTNQTTIRFVTRKLDFTHRIVGRLLNEAGQPLAGYSFGAEIYENSSSFRTNLITGTNGAFVIEAVPATWSLCCLSPTNGTSVARVFPLRQVEVAETNSETQVAFVAPAATATLSVTTSNLWGWNVFVSTEAFGETYSFGQTVFFEPNYPYLFQVFDGVWTVSVTGPAFTSFSGAKKVTPPAPVVVAVTNGTVSVAMNGVLAPGSSPQVQSVRTVTMGGTAVTNATVYAQLDGAFFSVQPQPPGPSIPGYHELSLEEGRWRIGATTYSGYVGWFVEREVVIRSDVAPAEIKFAFPEPDSGPRISGRVRCPDGAGLAGQSVLLHTSDGTTRHDIYLKTDALGGFGTNVFPGRWEAVVSSTCRLVSTVIVSNQDVELEFELCRAAGGARVPVTVSLLDERDAVLTDSQLTFYSGLDMLETNSASLPASLSLRPGIWSASVSPAFYDYGADLYTLRPTLAWQLPTGVTETNLVLVTRQATSRIEGRLRDEQGRLLTTGYASAWTSVNGTNFLVRGFVGAGYFSLNVFPGEWHVGASMSGYPSVGVPGDAVPINFLFGPGQSNRYTTPAPRFLRVSNSVAKCEFVVTNLSVPGNVVVVAKVVQETGERVSSCRVYAYETGGTRSQEARPDENGTVRFDLKSGRFTLATFQDFLDSPDGPLLWPSLSFDATAPSNYVVLVVRSAPRRISGTVANASVTVFLPYVYATIDSQGTNYLSSTCADHAGGFSLPVFPGQWTVRFYDYFLNAFGHQSISPRVVNVPPTGSFPSAEFVLTPIAGDFRLARFLNPVLRPDGGLRLELRGQTDLGWRIERSEDLRDWTFVDLQPGASGTVVIEQPPAPSRQSAFYRAVWVR